MERTGLVLGAGGVGGQAFHLTLLAALEDVRGWRGDDADLVVGTSVASLVGFLIRAGVSTDELIREAAGRDLGAPDDVLTLVGHAPDPPDARLRLGPPHVPLREVSAHLRREPRLPARVALGCLLPRGECEVDAHAPWIDEVAGGHQPSRPLRICATQLASMQRVVWHGRQPGRPSTGAAVAALRREGVRIHVLEPRAPEQTTLREATMDVGSDTKRAIDRLRDSLGARLSGRAAAG